MPPSRTPASRRPNAATYRATLEGLFARRRFGMRPGLEVVRALLEALDHPERAFPAIHITGSKGKGSTAALSEAVLRGHGLRTGLFTSPHLASYRERVQVDRTPISKEAVVRGVERVDAAARALRESGRIDREPTFFEVTTALGLDHFARAGVEVAVVEVGLGGRLDSTNVLDSKVGVLTTIELEHTDVLGPTLELIATEKSGILKPGMSAVVGPLPPPALSVVLRAADAAGLPVLRLGREVEVVDREISEEGQRVAVRLPGHPAFSVEIPLYGTFQATNGALALAASARFLEATGRAFDPRRARTGLATVRWRGRLERAARRPDLYYDVAHTPESARALAESLGEIAPLADPAENVLVLGCLTGKDLPRILDALAPLARTLVVVPVRSSRSMRPADIRAAAVGLFPRVVEARSVEEGVRLGRAATGADGYTVVAGSDYLIGELLRPSRSDEEPDLSDPGVGAPNLSPASGVGSR